MKLSLQEAEDVIDLYSRLVINANYKLKIIKNIETVEDLKESSPQKQYYLRKEISKNIHYFINLFLENSSLSDEEKEIVENWRNSVRSKFIVFKHFENYTVFMDISTSQFYGIVGLANDLRQLLPGFSLPEVTETTILPYKDKIIYDGILGGTGIQFSDSVSSIIADTLRDATRENKIITSFIEGEPSYDIINLGKDNSGDYDISGKTLVRKSQKVGRNDLCLCGSGKKYKKCCGK